MQLGEVFFLNFEVQQYWGTSLEPFQLNGCHFFIIPLNGKQYIYLWQHTSPNKPNLEFCFWKKMNFCHRKFNVTFCQFFAQKKDQLGVELDGTNAMESYC